MFGHPFYFINTARCITSKTGEINKISGYKQENQSTGNSIFHNPLKSFKA